MMPYNLHQGKKLTHVLVEIEMRNKCFRAIDNYLLKLMIKMLLEKFLSIETNAETQFIVSDNYFTNCH